MSEFNQQQQGFQKTPVSWSYPRSLSRAKVSKYCSALSESSRRAEHSYSTISSICRGPLLSPLCCYVLESNIRAGGRAESAPEGQSAAAPPVPGPVTIPRPGGSPKPCMMSERRRSPAHLRRAKFKYDVFRGCRLLYPLGGVTRALPPAT